MVEKDPEFGPGVVFLEPVGHVAYDTYVASLLKNRDGSCVSPQLSGALYEAGCDWG